MREIRENNVPGEVADLLDSDLKANAGGDEIEAEA
jgi:hypothetical protein